MAHIVIIGAGLTGLSAAYHLEKKGFYDYTLFEKESAIGGLCGSVYQDGFTFDFTGHYLHISDPYFRSFIEDIYGIENLNAITRRSFIYSQNVYTRYPFQINLYGLPLETIAECIEGYIKRPNNKKVRSFPEWVLTNFGSGFAKHFFLPFQRKIFAHPLNTITASWTGRFVPSTSLKEILQGSFNLSDDPVGYNAHFYYPKQGGIIAWVKGIADRLKNPIQTNFRVTSINMKHKIIEFSNGHCQPFSQLISTMPLNLLLASMQETSSSSLSTATSHLHCNSVINFNLGVRRADLSDKHWIYFPEKQYPFYRLGFPHNSAASMTPAGCSSLYGEFSYIKKSNAWITGTLKQAITATKKLFLLEPHEIMTEKVMSIGHAYVIYDFWRERNLPSIHKRLEEQDIYSVGRYGEWKYSSMQEAVLDGKKIAEKLVIIPARKDQHAEIPLPTQKPLQRQTIV